MTLIVLILKIPHILNYWNITKKNDLPFNEVKTWSESLSTGEIFSLIIFPLALPSLLLPSPKSFGEYLYGEDYTKKQIKDSLKIHDELLKNSHILNDEENANMTQELLQDAQNCEIIPPQKFITCENYQ